MKTDMADTSIEAYNDIKPTLGKNQYLVLKCIDRFNRPVCNYELAKELGWPINCVTGRVRELREAGIVISVKKMTSPTGRTAWYWQSKWNDYLISTDAAANDG